MAVPVKPVAKVVYVCDDAVHNPVTGKLTLVNLWDAVRVPPDRTFPYSLGKLCVFVWWRGGLGKVRTRVDIVQGSTGIVIRRTRGYVLHFDGRMSSIWGRYMIENCMFPA